MADISALSETDASNTSITGISVAEGCPPSNVNDAIRNLAGMLKRDWDKKGATKSSAGNDTITLTLDTAPASYVRGEVIAFVAGGTNTGAATLNVNALGAKSIKKGSAGATALAAGDIAAGGVYVLQYDGTNFQLVNPGSTAVGNDLIAIEALSAIGIPVRTATDTWAIQNAGVAEWGGTSGGSANAQTVSITPAVVAYVAGMAVTFKAGFTNTGATTINVNSIGTKNIFNDNVALLGGEIIASDFYTVFYDGTQFQLIGTPAALQARRYFVEATLTDAAPTTWDLATQQNAVWTLGASRTLSTPTNMKAGQTGNLEIRQDGTGNRVITWPGATIFKWPGGTVPVLSTAASAVDLLSYKCRASDMLVSLQKGFA